MPEIDDDRLLNDLRALREFGAHGNGVVRRSLSPVDMDSRAWLAERMAAAGLDPVIDGVGTVFGRSPNAGPALIIGSHSDTQPRGGWLDGAMGVIYGLEVARSLAEAPDTAGFAVDVASWIDEEGAYFGMLGSRSFIDDLPAGVFDQATGADGRTLGAAIEAAGLAGRDRARLDPARHAAYLEAHIEQGPHLEERGKHIGVVTGIVGMRDYTVAFHGQPNHAGTTPMDRRKDAGAALIGYAHALDGEFRRRAGPATVWTIGRVAFDPGTGSIIPGYAEMDLQFRDADEAKLDELEQAARDLAARRGGDVAIELRPHDDHVGAVAMDADLQGHVAAAAEARAPGDWMRLPSAAGHDAQILARRLPSAMLFVPSIGGISHDFAEDTGDADLVLGCRVMADAAARILKDLAGGG